jgi:hypothetical protein
MATSELIDFSGVDTLRRCLPGLVLTAAGAAIGLLLFA